MNPLAFWQQKLIQFFHDPPGKPYSFVASVGGHEGLASALLNAFTEQQRQNLTHNPAPDWAAAGADRPVVDTYSYGARPKDSSISGDIEPIESKTARRWAGSNQVCDSEIPETLDSFLQNPVVTHPLAGGPPLRAVHPNGAIPQPGRERDLERALQIEAQLKVVSSLSITAKDWDKAFRLKIAFLRIWRRYREDLVREFCGRDEGDLLWEAMPADTRIPDHSIWDHLHVATALSFLPAPGQSDPAREPWLLRFDLTPIQEFISESRTPRDLWISSFLLAELTFHAMLPIIEDFGPDNILYPDLRGNQRMDCWFARPNQDIPIDALPESKKHPHTYAALLPGAFVAVLPRGDKTGFYALQRVAERCQQQLKKRWSDLAAVARHYLQERAQEENLGRAWEQTWDGQHAEPPIKGVWSAVPWRNDHDTREARLKPWIPPTDWTRYQKAYGVFEQTNKAYLRNERGFDYPLVHHQLGQRQALRQEARPYPQTFDGKGEKCTLCKRRQALGPAEAAVQATETRRQAVRDFWKALDKDTQGKERLCAICAFKRYLVRAGGKGQGINLIWAGPEGAEENARVPFPSTATLAAQVALEQVVREPSLHPALEKVIQAHDNAGLKKTSFPRALIRLAHASDSGQVAAEFLQREAQEVFFPHALDAHIDALRRAQDPSADKLVDLRGAVVALRHAMRQRGMDDPQTRFALVLVDGDRLGRLLMGDEQQLKVTWEQVLHPAVWEPLRALPQTGWPELLGSSRHITPSIHAFISRALAEYSHRIVPWVVEREFNGRLVYAGGDDVLALAPADTALALAARLQRLYSASWIQDRDHEADPWGLPGSAYDPQKDRRRFHPIATSDALPADFAKHPIIPMLGEHNSVSAAVVYAHFKTGIAGMLRHARNLLKDVAKERLNRGAVALSYWSRNGDKATIALKWKDDPEAKVASLREAFAGSLPGRLPYKLRDALERLALPAERRDDARLMSGLLRRALDGATLPEKQEQDVLTLWRAGHSTHPTEPQRSLDGLLLCRALALPADDQDDEDEDDQ